MNPESVTTTTRRLRALAKSGIAAGLHRTGVGRLAGHFRGLHRQPLVIGYHRVVSDFQASAESAIPAMLISTDTFEAHLDWLARQYRFASLDELAGEPGSEGSDDRPMAAITFDDGYRDVYDHAFPILQRRGIPFAVFVVPDLVGTRRLQTHDELYWLMLRILDLPAPERERILDDGTASLPSASRRRARNSLNGGDAFAATRAALDALNRSQLRRLVACLRRRIPMPERVTRELQSLDWDMLREMVAAGVTIGSHTRTHALLTNEPPRVVRSEVEISRRELEERLNTPIRHFAYPDGRFDALAVDAVARAGYATAVTTCRHRDPEYPHLSIPRRLLWENSCTGADGRFSPSIMSCQVNGIFDAADPCRIRHRARNDALHHGHVVRAR